MTKQVEVGDVWENKYNKVVIISIYRIYRIINVDYINLVDDKLITNGCSLKGFKMEGYSYIGKSKVNISELFEVQYEINR